MSLAKDYGRTASILQKKTSHKTILALICIMALSSSLWGATACYNGVDSSDKCYVDNAGFTNDGSLPENAIVSFESSNLTFTNNATIAEAIFGGGSDMVGNDTLNNTGTITGNVSFGGDSQTTSTGNIINNSGTIGGSVIDSTTGSYYSSITLNNSGEIAQGVKMQGASTFNTSNTGDSGNGFKLYNTGTIGLYDDSGTYYHLYLGNAYTINSTNYNPTIYSYHNTITQDASTFNAFTTYSSQSTDTNHLVIKKNTLSSCSSDNSCIYNVRFDSSFTFYISVDGDFSYGEWYSLSKLILDEEGNTYVFYYTGSDEEQDSSAIYSHLSLTNSALTLEQSEDGASFRIFVQTLNSIGNSIYARAIQTANIMGSQIKSSTFGMYHQSSPNRFASLTQNQRIALLESSREKYFYGASAMNVASSARRNAGVKSLGSKNTIKAESSTVSVQATESSTNQTDSDAIEESSVPTLQVAQKADDNYYAFFSPFISYDKLDDAQKLDGTSYGFVTGFNAKLGDSNTLGLHFGALFGGVSGEGSANSLDITTTSLVLGLHYRADFNYGLYVKAYLDGYMFSNKIEYTTSYIETQKPSDFGAGVSAYFGKDFDFDSGGVLGAEIGLQYLGINGSKMTFEQDNEYESTFLNLLYADLGVNYYKLFQSGFGLNAQAGVKALLTTPEFNIIINNVSMSDKISTDKVLGYGGVGVSYFINPNMELGLQYLGHFGDKSTAHTGWFHIRAWW